MSSSDITTIKLSKKTVKKITNLKIHPRQSYQEVIMDLLKNEKKKIKR